MYQFLRIIALIILIVLSLVDFKFVSFLVKKEWLYILSTLIIIIMLFIDAITGFILTLGLITIILKMYNLQVPWGYNNNKNDEKMLDYITPEHLRSAQNNIIIDEENYKKEWKGIQGVYGEDVYGAQGLEILPGYSNEITENL
jgi:hypothetical protein